MSLARMTTEVQVFPTVRRIDTASSRADGDKKEANPMRILLTLTALITLAACDVPFVPLI
jgi:hypothetical protein